MRTRSTIAAVSVFMTAIAPAFAQDVLPTAVTEGLEGQLVWHDGSGGATTRAREATMFGNFMRETGVTLRADYNSSATKFFAAMESGADVPWSMVEFSTKGDFLRAKEAGYLEKLDPAVVDLSLLGEGAHDEHGISVMRYGIVFTYNTESFPEGKAPASMRDLFDTETYPGARCMFEYPQFGAVLESALLADGVAPTDLYPLDLDRAFAKLDTIKDDILWWSNGDDAIRLLSSGECTMGVAWSGRVFTAVRDDNAPLAMSWDGSLYSQAVYAVPKGAPNPAAGQALIAWSIADTDGQIEFVKQIGYTTDIKSLTINQYGADLAPWILTPENASVAIEEDAAYYAEHLPEIVDRFNRWVALN